MCLSECVCSCACVCLCVCVCVSIRACGGRKRLKQIEFLAFFLKRRELISECYNFIFLKRSNHCSRACISNFLSFLLKFPSFLFFFLQPPSSLFLFFSMLISCFFSFFDLPFLLLFCLMIWQKFETIIVFV